jgi:putative transposase
LTRAIVSLASQYGSYGYRRITSLLAEAGWQVGCDRVQRIWRGRLWLNDGSCIRLRPQHRNHVWSYDFVEAQSHDGRRIRLMTLIDEFTRECLTIRVARRINSFGVIETTADVMLERGAPEHIRSHNGPEMTAKIVRSWLAKLGTKTLYIEPGSPWENGYCESFNGSTEKSSTAIRYRIAMSAGSPISPQ